MTRKSFVAETREEAIKSYVAVALDYRKNYTRGGIGWSVAKKAIRKAKRIKAAEDWKDEYLNKGL